MHDFYHNQLLTDAANFQPRAGNTYVEIVHSGNPQSITVSEGNIDEFDIPTWLRRDSLSQTSPEDGTLRVLIGSPEEHLSDVELLPLPISRHAYETVCKEWSLPSELLRMMLSTLPLALTFTAPGPQDRLLQGLMLRGAKSRDWNFCFALVHDPHTQSTNAILNGMQGHEIEKLLHCLKTSKQHVRDPSLIPIFLLELKVHFFAILLEKRALGIEQIEYSTGMRHGFSTDPRRNTMIDKERKDLATTLDFDPITQKLTGVTGTLSFCDMTFNSSKRALDAVTRLRDTSGLKSPTELSIQPGESNDLTRRADYLYELIEGSISHCAVLSARTKAQVQTVYSMIGQRDNRLNIQTAAASREIAATSLVHNEAMKHIAEDSRKIAILTRRDSLDMRIIAAVTLVFLPGTFIATMFGSGFFRFLPEGSSKVVSGWIWLYFVLTIGITAIVLLFWWFYSRRQTRSLFDAELQDQMVSKAARDLFSSNSVNRMHRLESTSHRHTELGGSPDDLIHRESRSSGVQVFGKS